MAAHVLRLRVVLLLGGLRGDRRHVVRVVSGLILLAAATAVACWALLSMTDAPTDVAQTVIVLGGSALTLGFTLAPLIAGATDPLDPRRFAVFGVGGRSLASILVLAGFVSVPILVLIALAVCTAIVWEAHGVPVVLAATSALIAVLTCVLLARVCMAVTALALRERRSRELTGLFALTIVVVLVPVGVFLASLEWDGHVPTQLESAVSVLAATPFGAAWSLPGLVAGGRSAGIPVAVAIGTVVVLWLAWHQLVSRLLTTTERPAAVRERGGLGWFAVAPGTATGAVAARSLLYWMRDARYLVNVIVVPVVALLAAVPLLIAGVPAPIVALVPVPIMALFFGWLPHNDLAYDSTAVWMHIASGIRGSADRLGRLVPILLIGVPILAVSIPFAITLYDRWALLPAMVGVCASLFLGGLGLSSIASVLSPYPVSRPGDSPFQQPQRSSAWGAITQAIVLLGAIVVSAPTLWWAWLALSRDIDYALAALWGGLGTGLGVLLAGIAIGGVLFGRRGTRLMEFAEAA
ncbi:MAG TPA: hypothetical protein VNT50_00525 [Microbacterium sp.]|uniref:hypothetical protein n=1 Tax=Microbacterium sp. TaxID=51671 RepID=UPI002C6EED5E|nr:hypothetical protein [Microbacterium sp.]HWI29949.1 hypothetical protein [Microbacterium sp.]